MSRSRLKSKITAFKSKPVTSLVKTRRRTGAGKNVEKNGAPVPPLSPSEDELQVRIRELIKLAKEQGYLTREDVHEALSGDDCTAEDLPPGPKPRPVRAETRTVPMGAPSIR